MDAAEIESERRFSAGPAEPPDERSRFLTPELKSKGDDSAPRRRVGGGASSWDSASVSFSILTAGRLLLKSMILSAFLPAPGDGVAPAGGDITLAECLVAAAAAAAGREPNRP